MTKLSAGLLMCRIADGIGLQYFLVHPGGPFFKNKSAGYWSIPKGLPEGEEDLMQTAQREFYEETGIRSAPPYHALGFVNQKAGRLYMPGLSRVCGSLSAELFAILFRLSGLPARAREWNFRRWMMPDGSTIPRPQVP